MLTVGDLRRLLAESEYPDDLPVLLRVDDAVEPRGDVFDLDPGMYGMVTTKGDLVATTVRRAAR